jgi:signal transduction histidine kinase/HD-like signal output (HDOD) protein
MQLAERKLTDASISRMVDMERLPTLPSIAMEAIRLLEGEESNFDSIADLLRNDQVLTGRILQYANSAFFALRQPVSSISQAVALIGFDALRTIILSVSIFDCFSGKLAPLKKKLLGFWLHSIGVAATAEILAKRLGFPLPEEAYLAGLIHDLGKLVCYQAMPEQFLKLCQELDRQGTYSTKTLPLTLEENLLGMNHIDAGRLLAEKWNLPEPLARVIRLHHQPVFETILPDEEHLPQLIRFADALCVTHQIGSSYFLTSGPFSHEHYHFALEGMMMHHHLSADDLDGIMSQVHTRVKSLAEVLGIWDERTYRRLVSAANVSLGDLGLRLDSDRRELSRANQVLAAINEMSRKLRPGLSLPAAAKIVLTAAGEAFRIRRCLCMIKDSAAQIFVGKFLEDDTFHEVEVPARLSELQKFSLGSGSEIEREAAQRLKQTSLEMAQGSPVETGVLNLVAGSSFLATFFVADPESFWQKDPILGELVIDFSEEITDPSGIRKHFETFALAAGNGIEGILLHQHLALHAKELEETSRKMEESQRQLFHSHRLATVGRLAAGAAHEINNPLTIISLNAQIINRHLGRKKEFKDIRDRVQVVTEQGERISKIIQDLMGFARPTQPKFFPSSPADIMAKVLSVLADRVSMGNIEVRNIISPDLPLVMVDPLQIEQVFMNLLVNANHAMIPHGGTISIEGQRTNGFVEVSITDTGTGIAEKDLSKIFDPFFTTKKEGEGTGLGLAVCHSIIEHNEGSMRVMSKVDVGSTFTVVLPVDKGSRLRQMKKALDSETLADQAVRPKKYRILVIDDERIINETLQESLRAAGYEVDGAFDGVEGISRLRFAEYHLVLLDIRMPRKDGLEVLQFIREEFPEVKVIIITGLASKEEIQETVHQGAYACFKKPFNLEKVLQKVRSALESA